MWEHLNKDHLTVSILMNRSFREFDLEKREKFLADLSYVANCSIDEIQEVKFWDACITFQAILPLNPAEKLVKLWEAFRSSASQIDAELAKFSGFVERHSVVSIYLPFAESPSHALAELIKSSKTKFASLSRPEDLPAGAIDGMLGVDSGELPYSDASEKEFFERQTKLFQEKKDFLVKCYPGLYVHFEDGKVIAAGENQIELVERAYKEGGVRPLFIKRVSEEDESRPQLWTILSSY